VKVIGYNTKYMLLRLGVRMCRTCFYDYGTNPPKPFVMTPEAGLQKESIECLDCMLLRHFKTELQ